MSKTGITRVTVKPGEPLPRGDTDWARLDAMTDEEVVAAGEARFRALGPEARKALRAVDQSLEALRMMEATKLPVAKGGTA